MFRVHLKFSDEVANQMQHCGWDLQNENEQHEQGEKVGVADDWIPRPWMSPDKETWRAGDRHVYRECSPP